MTPVCAVMHVFSHSALQKSIYQFIVFFGTRFSPYLQIEI